MKTHFKIITLIYVCFFFSINLFSQNVEKWQNIIGDATNRQLLYSVEKTPDNGYISVGYSSGYGSGSTNDIFVTKTDSIGNVIWTKNYSGIQNEIGVKIKKTHFGYVIFGSTNSYGLGRSESFLISIDQNGNILWQKTYGTNFNEDFNLPIVKAMIITNDSNIVFVSNQVKMASNPTAIPENNFNILKIDFNNGNILWQKKYSRIGFYIQFRSVDKTIDGGFIISGSMYDYDINVSADLPTLVKIDSSGNIQWSKVFPVNAISGGGGWIEKTIETSSGNFMSVGSKFGLNQWLDAYVFITDSLGNPKWGRVFGDLFFPSFTFSLEAFSGVVELSDSTFIASGYRSDVPQGASEPANSGNNDVLLVKLSQNGNTIWRKTIGKTNEDSYGNDILLNNNNSLTIVGSIIVQQNQDGHILKTDSDGNGACDTKNVFINEIQYVSSQNFNFTTEQPDFVASNANFSTINLNLTTNVLCYKCDINTSINHNSPLTFCEGDSAMLIVNGNPNNSLLWNNGNTSQNITVYNSGNYSVIVTDNNNCFGYDTVAVVSNSKPNSPVIFSNKNIICIGDSTEISSNTNCTTCDYFWHKDGQFTSNSRNSYFANESGTYSLAITNNNGCTSNSVDSIDIEVSNLPQFQVFIDGQNCVGNGQITVIGYATTSPYQYSINNSVYSFDSVFTNITEGEYLLSVKDSLGCTNDTTVSVVNIDSINISYVISNSTNIDSNDGAVKIITMGTNPPFQYSLNGSAFQNEDSYTGLSSGWNYLTIKDNNGCEFIDSFFVETSNMSSSINDRNKSDDLKIYPNPANNKVFIKFLGNEKIELIEIYDVVGKIINTKISKEVNDFTIHTENIPSGLYYIIVQISDNYTVTEKITIYH